MCPTSAQPAVELAAEHEPAADAGPERQQHQVARPSPGAVDELGESCGAAVVDHADRHPEAVLEHLAKPDVVESGCSPTPSAVPVRWSIRAGTPKPTPPRSPGSRSPRDRLDESVDELLLRRRRRRPLAELVRRAPVSSRIAGEDLRPAEVDPDDSPAVHRRVPYSAGWRRRTSPTASTAAVASRARSRQSRRRRARSPASRSRSTTRVRSASAGCAGSRGSRSSWSSLLGAPRAHRSPGASRATCPFSSGVSAANKRLDRERGARAALAKSNGFLLSHGTTILLLGTDSSTVAGRSGDRHSDSIMILRTDPSHHQLSYLSIPRDLLVHVDGLGNAKINAAYQSGGAALAIRTVHDFTGVPIDHVVIVDFNQLQGSDRRRGRDHDQRAGGRSSRTASTARTRRAPAAWSGRAGASTEGTQHMNGEQALIYSRIRENQLEPGRERPDAGRAPAGGRPGREAKLASVGHGRQASVRRQQADEAADDRPLHVAADGARLGEVPRVRVTHALLQARGRRDERRRLLGPAPVRGQPQRPRDVGRALGAAAADDDVRAGMPRRAPPAVALLVGRRGLDEDDEPPLGARRAPSSWTSRRAGAGRVTAAGVAAARRVRRAGLLAAIAGRGRNRSSRTPSPCSGPRPERARARAAMRRTPRTSSAPARSCRGTPRAGARSDTCTRRSAWDAEG